ncbi:MAG: hypothetical protein KGM42_14685 [Hyphomicrobiales bacterium]|nr:hypothetical protein [Hyphomicrobiales bacterium]
MSSIDRPFDLFPPAPASDKPLVVDGAMRKAGLELAAAVCAVLTVCGLALAATIALIM